jgi:hypothetical protein
MGPGLKTGRHSDPENPPGLKTGRHSEPENPPGLKTGRHSDPRVWGRVFRPGRQWPVLP